MPSRPRRVIPVAAAASTTLTFAACGDDLKPVPSDAGTGTSPSEQLSAELDHFANTLCKTYSRCAPEDFSSYFDNLAGCADYYKSYYMDDLASASRIGATSDPDACRLAIAGLLRCYTKVFANIACNDFNDPEFNRDGALCDAEYTAFLDDCDADPSAAGS